MFSKAKQMIEADRAVSPVIGVALMIGVTVLLGAVVGGFVTGLGDSLTQDAPNAQIEFDYDSNFDNLEIRHGGGETLSPDNTQQVRLTGPENGVDGNSTQYFIQTGESYIGDIVSFADEQGAETVVGPVQSGDILFEADNYPPDGESKLIWVGPEGDTTATLAEFEGPDA